MRIAIIGEYNPSFRPHVATNEAIEHSRRLITQDFVAEWVTTDFVEANLESFVMTYHGYWIAPGSPYKSLKGALEAIKYARMHHIPAFGTCGGFQHMVLEFARNVLYIKDAAHAENNPYASKLVINPLSCNLKGEPLEVEIIDKNSKVFDIFQSERSMEKYYCNFGLNPDYQDLFNKKGFRIVGSDKHKEARIMELKDHPFFIGTLFVPQDNSSIEHPHPLVLAFLKAVETTFRTSAAFSA